jgi:hypothetical protein
MGQRDARRVADDQPPPGGFRRVGKASLHESAVRPTCSSATGRHPQVQTMGKRWVWAEEVARLEIEKQDS